MLFYYRLYTTKGHGFFSVEKNAFAKVVDPRSCCAREPALRTWRDECQLSP